MKSKYEQKKYLEEEADLFRKLVAQNIGILDEYGAKIGTPSERMLAFVMGVHRRLGAKSPMRGLDRELICMIMYENALKHTQLPSHS